MECEVLKIEKEFVTLSWPAPFLSMVFPKKMLKSYGCPVSKLKVGNVLNEEWQVIK